MKKLIFSALLLCLSNLSFSNVKITYIPDYKDGYLNVKHLNDAILLASLQYDSVDIDLVIPKGVYLLPNNTTINMNNHLNLLCDSVFFIYKWVTDDYKQDIIHFAQRTHSSIKGLTIDLKQAYKDKKPTYANADKYVNRSAIQLEGCDNITIENVKIFKILGAGIVLSNTKNSTIKNCYIDGSWVYGNETGVQGYSINLVGILTTNNKIFGNILKDSRHQIVIQYEANNNLVEANKMYETKALKKFLFFEVFDSNFTFNLTLHGNGPFENIVKDNYADHRISIDNVKEIPNGISNSFIGNTVNGLIDVQSKAPDYLYNQGQMIKNNKYKTLKVEAKNCIVSGNSKLK